MTKVEKLKKWIVESNTLVVLTGAGISTASGIPDFRSSKDCMAELILTYGYMENHPGEFTKYCMEYLYHKEALPNDAHRFLKKLEDMGMLNSIITQNIDDLHQNAGSKRVFPLHGSINKWHCMECEKSYNPEELSKAHSNYCSCGGFVRPNITLYGEPLDEAYYHLAQTVSQIADTYIVIGSSLLVDPAASLIRFYSGNRLVIINRNSTPYDKYADLVIRRDIVDVIHELEFIFKSTT